MKNFLKMWLFLITLSGFNHGMLIYSQVEENNQYLLLIEVPIVDVASKKSEKLNDAPGVITVITSDEIRDFGGLTVFDILQRACNIQPLGSHLFTNNFMSSRGALFNHYDNHILILINGRPYRDGTGAGYNSSFYNIFPVDRIDRIEIIRGPGSVLYGTDAFDGVVNIITKKPENDFNVKLSAGGGSFGARTFDSTAGYSNENFSAIANVNYFNDKGWDYKAWTAHPSEGIRYGEMKYDHDNISESFFLKYKNFTLSVYSSKVDGGNLGIIPFWVVSGGGNGQSELKTEWTYIDAGYSQKFGEFHELKANLTFNKSYFSLHSYGIQTSAEAGQSLLGEIFLNGTLAEKVDYLIGGTIENSKRDDLSESEHQKITDYDLKNWSAYFQIDYKPFDSLKLFAGMQHNKPDDSYSVTVPRIGGIYQINKEAGLKLLYSEAFRAPGPMETNVYYPGVIIGNPDLGPEKVKTIDFQLFYNSDITQSALTFYKSKYSNLVTRVPHQTIIPLSSTYINGVTRLTQGLEIESKIKLSDKLYFTASGAYQTEKDDTLLTPDYMIKMGLSYNIAHGLQMGIFDTHYGEAGNNTGSVLNPPADAVDLLDISLTYLPYVVPNLTLSLWVKNALDDDYYFPEFSKNWVNTLPLGSGRAIYAKASYEF